MTTDWFAYDYEDGADFYSTEGEARARVEELLEVERDGAVDGWNPDIESICWGRVVGRIVQTRCEPAPEGSEFDEIHDYAAKTFDDPAMARVRSLESELARLRRVEEAARKLCEWNKNDYMEPLRAALEAKP